MPVWAIKIPYRLLLRLWFLTTLRGPWEVLPPDIGVNLAIAKANDQVDNRNAAQSGVSTMTVAVNELGFLG